MWWATGGIGSKWPIWKREAPGLFLAGHYRDGISLGDSIVSGCNVADRIKSFCRSGQTRRAACTQLEIGMKQGVLLVNLGSPDSPSVPDVRRYLREFLMDGRVLDVNWLVRFCIVHFAILPSRPKQSAHAYQSIWTPEGSPLVVDQPERAEEASGAGGCAGGTGDALPESVDPLCACAS